MSSTHLRAGAALGFVNIAAQTALGLAITPLLVRGLGPAGFGLYSLIGAVSAYLAVLDFGIGATVVRYVAKFRAEANERLAEQFVTLAVAIQGTLSILVVAAGIFAHWRAADLLGPAPTANEIADARLMLVVVTANVALSLPLGAITAVVMAHERFVFVRLVTLGRLLVRAVAIAGLIAASRGAPAIVLADAILNVVFGAATAAYAFGRLGVKFAWPRFRPEFVWEVFKYSGFIFVGAIVDLLYWRVGQVVLGVSAGSAAVGVFAIAVQFASIFIQCSTAISGVLLPRVTGMVVRRVGAHELTHALTLSGRLQLPVLGYLLISFTLFGRDFIVLWAGAAYEDAWAVAMVMLVPLVVPLFQNVGIEILKALNLHAFRSMTYLVVACANVIATAAITPQYGALGAALGTGLSLLIGNVVVMNVYYHFRVGLDMRRFYRETLRGLGVAMALAGMIGAATLLAGGVSWSALIVRGVVFSIVYVGLVWAIGFNDAERAIVRGVSKRGGSGERGGSEAQSLCNASAVERSMR